MKKITFLSICILMVTNLFATDYYVKSTGSPTADGLSEANAFNTVNVAVTNAGVLDGDRIFIVGAINQTGSVGITKSLTFVGMNNAVITGGTVRMYNLATAGKTISFSGITFQNAAMSAVTTGGAVASLTVASDITFTNCVFQNNIATGNGGALSATAGNLTITNCTFSGNSTTAGNGGAIFADGAGVLSVTTSNFSGNSAATSAGTTANGGAISVGPNVSRQSLISYSTFYNNTTDLQGGALAFFGTNATSELKNITCFENKIRSTTANADRGAGIRIEGTRAFAIKNTLVFGNTARTAGTAIASGIGATLLVTLTLTNSLSNSTVPAPDAGDVVTGSNTAANLASSNLAYDTSSRFVKYTLPTLGDATPIGFGNDGKDVGAWDSASFWTGTSSTSWADPANWFNNGNNVVGATKDAVIGTGTFQPIIGANASVKSLTLNASTSLTVNSGFNLTVTGAVINNGTMTIENNANLIQVNDVANTGNITVKRNSNSLKRLDYTIWSSPVTSASLFLKTFSPLTLDARFYNYNEGTNFYNAVTTPTLPAATAFTKGAGYLIRMPDENPLIPGFLSDYYLGNAPLTYNGEFIGVPNNGTVTKAMAFTGDGYNMVGNPYPSTIDALAFIVANTANIESTLYFWRKINNPLDLSTAYAVYNSLGSTATASSEIPNGTIQVGQGFFVKAKSASNLTFTNAMRLGTVSTQFFKTKQVAKDRVWLNLTNIAGVFSQALVGYLADATQGVDNYDAKYINDSPIALTSSINGEEYTIQGRSTFDASDVVALNFKTDVAGDYTIALDHFDGVFAAGQDVYLVDSKTGAETDLKTGSYTFNATAGIDNARFSLKYQKTLKVDAPAFNENSVSVYKNNGTIYVNSGKIAISSIQVYDVQGRLIADRKNVKSSTATLENLKANNQVVLVKISGEDNSVVTKKVVN